MSSTKLLRQAVFCEFKADLEPQQVENAVAEFVALPDSIGAISDLQWGINNSTEGQDDGYTHCFLLTFQSEADQAEYVSHPNRIAFVKLIHPLLQQIFKFDFWAAPSVSRPETELHHAIFLKFKDDAEESSVKAVEDGFVKLADAVDEIKAFEWGRNVSTAGLDDGFTHCFIITFNSEAGRTAYRKNDQHWAFLEVLTPPMAQARVVDFFASCGEKPGFSKKPGF